MLQTERHQQQSQDKSLSGNRTQLSAVTELILFFRGQRNTEPDFPSLTKDC